jgi:hypothetical protein
LGRGGRVRGISNIFWIEFGGQRFFGTWILILGI